MAGRPLVLHSSIQGQAAAMHIRTVLARFAFWLCRYQTQFMRQDWASISYSAPEPLATDHVFATFGRTRCVSWLYYPFVGETSTVLGDR